MNPVPKIGFLGTLIIRLRQVEQGFSSFSANFLAYLRIFQSFVVPSAHSTLKNHRIVYQKLDKKEEIFVHRPLIPFTALSKAELIAKR